MSDDVCERAAEASAARLREMIEGVEDCERCRVWERQVLLSEQMRERAADRADAYRRLVAHLRARLASASEAVRRVAWEKAVLVREHEANIREWIDVDLDTTDALRKAEAERDALRGRVAGLEGALRDAETALGSLRPGGIWETPFKRVRGIIAAALAGTPTPDPRDERIAELEGALTRILGHCDQVCGYNYWVEVIAIAAREALAGTPAPDPRDGIVKAAHELERAYVIACRTGCEWKDSALVSTAVANVIAAVAVAAGQGQGSIADRQRRLEQIADSLTPEVVEAKMAEWREMEGSGEGEADE